MTLADKEELLLPLGLGVALGVIEDLVEPELVDEIGGKVDGGINDTEAHTVKEKWR